MADPIDVLIITALQSELKALLEIKEPGSTWTTATDGSVPLLQARPCIRPEALSEWLPPEPIEMGETAISRRNHAARL
jgi:hypothetical protein